MLTNSVLRDQLSSRLISKSDYEWINNVKTSIINNLDVTSQHNIEQLALFFNLSRRQFQRRIKLITGLSPKQFQQEIAMNRARVLLEEKIYGNVTAVALAVGIQNCARFSQMYFDKYGRKPSQYFRQLISYNTVSNILE
jgi:transcriptional regulator GlxA family with amidase domain